MEAWAAVAGEEASEAAVGEEVVGEAAVGEAASEAAVGEEVVGEAAVGEAAVQQAPRPKQETAT
jgi:hypothetical protein